MRSAAAVRRDSVTEWETQALVAAAAESIRAGILSVEPCLRPIHLQRFPEGSCGDATDLLATYLSTSGLGDSEYVLGSRMLHGVWHSHAWLLVAGLVVDITADQFGAHIPGVIVTRHSQWHGSWRGSIHRPAGLGHVRSRFAGGLRAFLQSMEVQHGGCRTN